MSKKDLIVIFSTKLERKEKILSALLKQKDSIGNYYLAMSNDFDQLSNTVLTNKGSIVGFILDFEHESPSKISEFSFKVSKLNEDIIPLYIPPTECNISETKLDMLPFVVKNKMYAQDLKGMLYRIPDFLKKCDKQLESC